MNIFKSILMLLALVPASLSQAQVRDERLTVNVANVNTLLDVTRVKVYENANVILFEGKYRVSDSAVLKITSTASNISIRASDKERNPTPYKQLDDNTFIINQPGKHWVDVTAIDFEKNIYVTQMVIASVGPRPPPDPDPDVDPDVDPDPTPDPDVPAPIDGDGLRILIVYETSEISKLPQKQQDVLYGQQIRRYMSENCEKVDGFPEWRILDAETKFQDTDNNFAKALARPRKEIPWIIISNGKTGYEGPLPDNPEMTISLIERFNE